MEWSIKAGSGVGFVVEILGRLMPGSSSVPEKSTENEESQKLQTPRFEGSTAPHCTQVFVTG
jgi:hypothetical protein